MDDVALQESLDAFAANPKAATATPPPKYDPNGRPVTRSTTFFDASDLANGHYVLHRDSVRKTFHTVIDGVVISLEDATPGKAPIEAADRPENLVDRLVYRRLAEMDKAKLLKARLSQNPWSSDYWALYQGCLGKRYADPKFPGSLKWEENHAYVKQHPVSAVLSSGGAGAVDLLSPAEKYDLLAGDPTGTLATAMWDEGRSYFDSSGSVETWMGICHGWAPASYMMPRPSKTVTVLAADGKTQVRFNPTDIKGLASLLWANANTVTRFIGGRSNDKDPAVDENGRPLSPQVFDTNPGTWHLCVVNQIGVAKRGFVMDATYDYEVWNQPVRSYKVTRNAPLTGQQANQLLGASKQLSTVNKAGTVAAKAWTQLHNLVVAPGQTLRVRMSGSDDADLYVRWNAQPTASSYTCRPYLEGSDELCELVVPADAKTAYVAVNGYATNSKYSVDVTLLDVAPAKYAFNDKATALRQMQMELSWIGESDFTTDGNLGGTIDQYTRKDVYDYVLELDAAGKIIGGEWIGASKQNHPDFLWLPVKKNPGTVAGVINYADVKQLFTLANGGAQPPVPAALAHDSGALAADAWKHYGPFTVDAAGLKAVLAVTTGDADLYVRKGAKPTATTYDCRPYEDGLTGESCSVGAGTWYVALHGYAATDFTLDVLKGQ